MKARSRILTIGAALALFAPASAAATPGWTAPGKYPVPTNASSLASIGYQAGGIAIVAYIEIVSISPTIQTVLHVGIVPPGGSYREQLRIPSTSTAVPNNVSLAVAPSGAAVVEWSALTTASGSSAPLTYLASYRAAGSGTWEAPATIATDATTNSTASRIVAAISADGTAAAGIEHPASPSAERIDVAVHPAAGAWSGPSRLGSTSASTSGLALGFDAHGDLTASFVLPNAGNHLLAVQTRPSSNGVWSAPNDVTPLDSVSDAYSAALGVAPDGSAVLALQFKPGGSNYDAYALTRSGAAGAWTAPVDVAPGGLDSSVLAAGVSPTDKAYVMYQFTGASNSGQDCVGAAAAPAGGSFSTPHCLSTTGFDSSAGGVAFRGNDAYFAWSGGDPGSGNPEAPDASRWLDGAAQPEAFTGLDSPSADLGFQQLVPDDDGGVVALWTVGSGLSTTLRAAAYDAGGPNLLSAAVPAFAPTGRPVAMGASFADLWSGIGAGSPSWNFGDGGAATGASIRHTYTRPGTYTVTISAADGLGNTTTSTHAIVVATPAPSVALSRVSQSRARWREASKHRASKLPVGTRVRFILNRDATVTLAFARIVTGRKVNGKCVAATAHNRHKPHCTIVQAAGVLSVNGRTGANTVTFAGQLPNGHKLSPGAYTLRLTASVGGHRAVSKPLVFTIVR